MRDHYNIEKRGEFYYIFLDNLFIFKKNGEIIGTIICECMNGKKIIPYVTKQLSIIRNDKITKILQ